MSVFTWTASYEDLVLAAIRKEIRKIWTALPAVIEDFDPVKMVVSCQPAITSEIIGRNGIIDGLHLPLLINVPVMFPGGGGWQMTCPVVKGDDCLVVFSKLCIDSWWEAGGVQRPIMKRYFDLSDGFAFVGVRSQPHTMDKYGSDRPYKTDRVELRSDDGKTWFGLENKGDKDNPKYGIDFHTGTYNGVVSAATTLAIKDNLTLTVDKEANITITGNLTLNCDGNADITVGGNCTVTSPQTTLTGGDVVIAGTVAPTGTGALCGIPNCLLTGAPQVGSISSGA